MTAGFYDAGVAGVFVLLVLSAVSAVLLGRPVRRVQAEHTLNGRFGEAPREALIRRWTTQLIDTAERYERLDHFHHQLRSRAFAGTTMRIERGHGDWRSWRFADGETWRVRHLERPPRQLRRLVVHGSVERGDHSLMVRTYVPGSHAVTLPVADAHRVSA